jgi:hypothetical protein
MVWPWQRNRDPRGRGADPRVARDSLSVVDTSVRELSPLSDPSYLADLRPIPAGRPGVSAAWPAVDIVGMTPSGESVTIGLDDRHGRLLLVFLSTRCDGCQTFWDGLRHPDALGLSADISPVAITRGPDALLPAEVAEASAGVEQAAVVMTDQAWSDYRVSGYPFFVLVDVATKTITGETVGFGWDDVLSMTGSEPELR